MDEPVPPTVPEPPQPNVPNPPVPEPPAPAVPEPPEPAVPYVPPTTILPDTVGNAPPIPEAFNPAAAPTPGVGNGVSIPPPPYGNVPDVPVAPPPISNFPASTVPETFKNDTPPNFPAGGEATPNLSTATILPVGKGGHEAVSYSSNGKKRIILPIIIGFLILLVLGGVAFFFFTQKNQATDTESEQAQTVEPTPEPTEEVSPTPTPLPMTTYKNSEFNFTLDYPQEWSQKESDLGAVVSFTEQFGTANPAKIKVLAVSTSADLKTYVEQSQKIAAQLYPGLVQVSSTDTTQGSQPATMVETTYPAKGGVNIHSLSLITINNGRAFTVSADVEDTNFENMRTTVNQILASFAFSL